MVHRACRLNYAGAKIARRPSPGPYERIALQARQTWSSGWGSTTIKLALDGDGRVASWVESLKHTCMFEKVLCIVRIPLYRLSIEAV